MHNASCASDELDARDFERRHIHAAVIGLGYVGLPLALTFSDAGFDVTGVDIDEHRLSLLSEGRSPVETARDEAVAKALASGRLYLQRETGDLRSADVIAICVPTPLQGESRPDTRHVEAACARVAATLRRGQLVIVCSTTYPGTTHGLCRRILEDASGLRAGRDFFLAHAPERLDPGGAHGETPAPRVVGGESEACARRASALLGRAGFAVVRVADTQTAEMTKLLENTFRLVNIALVNELAQICHALGGIDVWEVIHAAASKPYGFMPFVPGPGVGGHCIPVDPHYLAWRAARCGFESRLIAAAADVSRNMPEWVVEHVERQLGRDGRTLCGADVLVLGVAYKADLGDTRESPALAVMAQLLARGARLSYHDPHVPEIQVDGNALLSIPVDSARVAGTDLVLILTDHTGVDYAGICRHALRVFDARGVTRALGALPNVERL
jgi:UDP-N-acetyl-D-glucosamine dehydrogenase